MLDKEVSRYWGLSAHMRHGQFTKFKESYPYKHIKENAQFSMGLLI